MTAPFSATASWRTASPEPTEFIWFGIGSALSQQVTIYKSGVINFALDAAVAPRAFIAVTFRLASAAGKSHLLIPPCEFLKIPDERLDSFVTPSFVAQRVDSC